IANELTNGSHDDPEDEKSNETAAEVAQPLKHTTRPVYPGASGTPKAAPRRVFAVVRTHDPRCSKFWTTGKYGESSKFAYAGIFWHRGQERRVARPESAWAAADTPFADSGRATQPSIRKVWPMTPGKKTVLITGAAGNLGSKLRQHLQGRYNLRLLDVEPRGDGAIVSADLSVWDRQWVDCFTGSDVVIHLAGNPLAHQTWPNVIGPNIDAMINVFDAAVGARVPRLIFASSNHVMGGYKDDPHVKRLGHDTPPRPGARYEVDGEQRDSTPYAAAKLFGERLGKCYSEIHGISVIALRI